MDDIIRLKKVIEILNNNNIKWWIDHGTLLGIVRESRLLPWDRDIDISIFKADLEKAYNMFKESKPDLLSWFIKTRRNIKIIPYKKVQRTIELSTYRCKSDRDYSKLHSSFPRPKQKYPFRRIFWFMLRLLERVPLAIERWTANGSGKYMVCINIITNTIIERLTSLRHTMAFIYESTVPKHYFADIIPFKWHDMIINIPSDAESYLTFRYGKDWNVSKPNWKWQEEDHTVMKYSDTYADLKRSKTKRLLE